MIDSIWIWVPAICIFLLSVSIIASDRLFDTKSTSKKLAEDPSSKADQHEKAQLLDKAPQKEASPTKETLKPTSNKQTPDTTSKDILVVQTKSEVAPQANVPSDVSEIRALTGEGWLQRFRKGMSKTKNGLTSKLTSIITGKTQIDEDILEDIHETLYRADIGTKTVDKLVDGIRRKIPSGSATSAEAIQACLKDQIQDIFSQKAHEAFPVKSNEQPRVILVVGVNGVGKTTSIGKLGAHFLAEKQSVMFCAADTYRAAAIDQLKVWAERLGINIVAHQDGADPAAVAFDGVKSAMAKKVDNLIIDTAGRLHNKKELMDELQKIKRVISKDCPDAPHEVWLVIDATTGQNAFHQVEAFTEVVDLTGIIVTKLDGTAKGGVIVGVVDRYNIPVRYVGVGEKAADLRAFEPEQYVSAMI